MQPLPPKRFLNISTIKIVVRASWLFVRTAAGVVFGNHVQSDRRKVNPLIAPLAWSAVPMRPASHRKWERKQIDNFRLMHAMGPNVAGVIGTAIAAGTFMAIFGVH